MSITPEDEIRVGLCVTCTSSRKVIHPRGGASYWMCLKSESDPRFEKFPAIPVRQCTGYEAVAD